MINHEIRVEKTRFGIKVSVPEYKISIEVEDNITSYINARIYIYYLISGIETGSVVSFTKFFEEREEGRL